MRTTLATRHGAHSLEIRERPRGTLAVRLDSAAPQQVRKQIAASVRTMFALDDDLAPFYARIANDPLVGFARRGIGRLLRSPTAFEEVARTICTTNCAWSATIRMIEALVTHLGEAAPGATPGSWRGRAFPSATAVAEASESFFRDVARAGYRGAYLRTLGELVASGAVDLEALRAAPRSVLDDSELEKQLRELPGVGPYAAAHIMLLFGRCSRLVLDSWTRPYYAHLIGKKKVADRTIERQFRKYGEFAGLAFWLFLWKDRHEAVGA